VVLMDLKIENLKKKIIYRSNYRGTREMDKLLSSFVISVIDSLNMRELEDLLNFLGLDDDSLYKYNQGLMKSLPIKENNITALFKKYKYK
tara:strand:+ start:332 stop:601 length:270 start_codon:yes stop_codon:yes gene_type:complete